MVSRSHAVNGAGNPTTQYLAETRQELLDLSLRNTLINYRTLRARGVDVVDEVSAEVYRILVVEGKNMSFEALPEIGGEDQAFIQPDDNPRGELAAHHTDRMLRTNVSSSELQKRLFNSHYFARTSLEEQGVSSLYLALGMLEWYEDDSSDTTRWAPLLLIPVELERSNAQDRFHVMYTGEDIGENLSLSEKLSAEFGIAAPPFPDIDELDVDQYFDAWAETIASRSRWQVNRNKIALGFFSFGKFLMYRDLDAEIWPDEHRPEAHPIVGALLADGFEDTAPTYSDDVFIDDAVGPDEIHQVVDADSSQTLAILEANAGRNLVVQGPPGTGKSQTITNVISEAIAAGKTVLFVSEKMAALEVVKRRLDAVGMGDACLELHSHKTNKRSLLNELQRTLELGAPVVDDLQTEMQLLEDVRDRLNDYCIAVNQPVGETGITPYQAYGRLLSLRGDEPELTWPTIDVPNLRTWSAVEFERRASIVDELQARVAVMGRRPAEHPFYGVSRTVLLPSDQERIARLLGAARSALGELRTEAANLAALLNMPHADTLADCRQLVATGRAVDDAPADRPAGLASDAWSSRSDDVHDLISAGQGRREAYETWEDVVIPEVWDEDLLGLRQDLAAYQGKWWRFLSGRYRSARARLRGFVRSDASDDLEDPVAMIDEIMEGQRQAGTIEDENELGCELFGSAWRGLDSDWDALARQSEWAMSIHRQIRDGELPSSVLSLFDTSLDRHELTRLATTVEQHIQHYEQLMRDLTSVLEINPSRLGWEDDTPLNRSLGDQQHLLDSWYAHRNDLDQVVAFNVSVNTCREEGIGTVADLAVNWEGAGEHLGAAFRVNRNEAVIERAITERPALREFDHAGHEGVADRFRQLDETLLQHNRHRLAMMHWERLPRHQGGGQLAVLRREFEKKSRHLPIRRLMEKCGNAIQAVKPVFMMSPMSIATYLAPGSATFDLVVFDEASQVRPADALGALLRGKQAVVVGDSKQLPPTSFFDVLTQADEASDDDPVTRDIESILGLFVAQNTLQRMLRWHYRSRHESLIAVSNYEFYDNRLVVFPSPDASREHLGLVYHYLPDTAYDRGGSRTNKGEAAAVAGAVMAHAHNQPDRTLGVAAFSTAQTQAILDEVERLRREDPSSESFFNTGGVEPFFVKNLENVQGDERDVIFISVGYGRDTNGHLTMNFGPLNNDGGERRLNVLITRARQRCEIFTNLSADDIDVSRTSARGVVAFKRYLKYAETGQLDIPKFTGREMDSPFELAVYRALSGAGYQVQPQIGSAGFFIDLAVADPDRPGRYILGIECDGATYHSARSARDRDRLRQQVLEGLGWRIHRIWSTDWFRNPERELRRTVEAIERARAAGRSDATEANPGVLETSTIERQQADTVLEEPANGEAYRVAELSFRTNGRELHQIPPKELATAIVDVVNVESPIHAEEVARRITDAAGVNRIGKRIRSNIEQAIDNAARVGNVVYYGEFLWRPDMAEPPVRDRSAQSGFLKSIESIAPEEIETAIVRVVADSYGMARNDICQAAGRLLGFQRVSANIRVPIDAAIDRLIANSKLTEQGEFLVLAN